MDTLTPVRDVRRFLKALGPREVLFSRGDAGHSLFIVVSGAIEIVSERAGNDQVVKTAGPGEVFGEVALMDTGLRTAAARAGAGGAGVVEVDRARFVYLVGQQPAFALTVMRGLCRRVAELEQELREKTA